MSAPAIASLVCERYSDRDQDYLASELAACLAPLQHVDWPDQDWAELFWFYVTECVRDCVKLHPVQARSSVRAMGVTYGAKIHTMRANAAGWSDVEIDRFLSCYESHRLL